MSADKSAINSSNKKMDDPLRPKAVPLAAETVLWFEFLLDPQLITKHLQKPNPDPSALELMSQFISVTPDVIMPPQYDLTVPEAENLPGGIPVTPGAGVTSSAPMGNIDGLRIPRKQIALKILTLKVATWLKWNLDVLEKSLPIPKQLFLLRDLCTVCFGKLITIPLQQDFQPKISPDGHEHAARFALTFYHRWVLRLQILKDIAMKAARPSMANMFVPMEPMHQFFAPDIPPQNSVEYLQELCKSTEPFYVFTYDTFVTLHADTETMRQNFEQMQKISLPELRAQIYFDLVNFYLYTKQYRLAREAVNECRRNLKEMKVDYKSESAKRTDSGYIFCHVNDDELEGYLLACGCSEQRTTLTERFNASSLKQYKDIIEILQEDNHVHEIPLVSRRILELDIEAVISQGTLKEPRTLEMQVAALNVVRSIFENGNIFASVDYFEKYRHMNCFVAIIDAISSVLPHCTLSERNTIKNFLIDCILKQNNGKQFLQQVKHIQFFTATELRDLERQTAEEELLVPTLATLSEWKFSSKIMRIEVGSLERQLISCTNANTVRKLLVKLAATNPTKPLWTVNPSWEIATPLKSLLMSMQRGFLQDFAYVLLGKAREMTAKNDYIGAVSMLSVLKSETQRQELSNTTIVSKLGKLVNWEILLIQITQCLDEWNRKTLDLQSLGNRCKQCLASLQTNDNIIPRIEIIESCAIMLLNLGDWNALMFLDKRLPQLELPIAFAATVLDMEKMKGSKKICRDAFDLVLQMFVNTTKRSGGPGGGGGSGSGGSSRNSPSLAVSTGLQPFLKRIRHQLVFSLAISCLGKIQNILRDDTNHDLSGEYMHLWPAVIPSPLAYSVRIVCETLHWLLTEALKYYPQTITWLKMKGDLELAIGNNEAAMRCYVNALITGTDYCTFPLQRNVADDYVIHKMIRCSSNLGCHMQATVLCQFLEEIDYGIVFKRLTEKSSNFTDAMDAYYNCIWDTTLLEFIINLHARKGEHSRKLEAIAIMGSLELNANNNDEIKREAAAIRKTRFLRALAKQYLL
ncbi:integrator complex subunit 8 [Anastrepha obliqua]|uniref:integrator complex subunit 8 n=1 Tax=Anastrepha obliqua TaxID=95512 RepID=UPI00240A79E8|nr:integrator complex subunit 8 [Anastrepha obliqua]